MLMVEKIKKHRYFQAMRMKNENMLDTLTETVCRDMIIAYVQYLIKTNIRFSFCILDVDNFKMINDTYGHQAGDEILAVVSQNIMQVLPENAVLGRFGGDEFLVVIEGVTDYNTLDKEFKKIYKTGIRKTVVLNTGKTIAITATSGIATFPHDAQNYDGLFNVCDKCLYYGKKKGRNCYTIYMDYLHHSIDISKSAKKNISERIMQLYRTFDTSEKKIKIYKAMEYLANDISITGVAYFYKNKIRISYEKNPDYGLPPSFDTEFLSKLETQEFIRVDDYSMFKNDNIPLYEFCYANNLLSFVIYRVEVLGKDYGYVLFYDSDFKRVWQDDDIALFTIFVRTLGTIVYFKN